MADWDSVKEVVDEYCDQQIEERVAAGKEVTMLRLQIAHLRESMIRERFSTRREWNETLQEIADICKGLPQYDKIVSKLVEAG